ncbi:BrnT family toxin [Salinarimonas chemoclinalis]|uniref:BrnT family toxin n=1 Tax=Salinarimonas chemoclinalis TaxID=3241599 RepID=UPI00355673C9
MAVRIDGIEGDAGNWPKCGKHGVSRDEIEHVLTNIEFRIPDPFPREVRYRTAGRTPNGRHVFLVFTYRQLGDRLLVRAVSARYMHEKEVKAYERAKKALALPPERRGG